jgi:glycerol uptake facilitator-like aquaporin
MLLLLLQIVGAIFGSLLAAALVPEAHVGECFVCQHHGVIVTCYAAVLVVAYTMRVQPSIIAGMSNGSPGCFSTPTSCQSSSSLLTLVFLNKMLTLHSTHVAYYPRSSSFLDRHGFCSQHSAHVASCCSATAAGMGNGGPGCFDLTTIDQTITKSQLFGWEVVMTFTLISVVYACGVAKPGHGSFTPLAVGLSLVACAGTGGKYSGAALNPARVIGEKTFDQHRVL